MRRSQPRSELTTKPLTLPVAPRERPDEPSGREEPGPLPPPLRQQERLSRPEAPSIDMCSAYVRRQRPPPISQLCRCDPASGARSLPRCSRTWRLDPRRITRAIHPGSRRPRAACRLLQFNHDRRAQPPDRSNPAHRARGRPRAQLQQAAERRLSPPPVVLRNRVAKLLFEAQPAEMSRARGMAGRNPMLAPSTTIARGGSLTPTRSARTPRVAGTLQRRHGDIYAEEGSQ
jgi:hypothetical protein